MIFWLAVSALAVGAVALVWLPARRLDRVASAAGRDDQLRRLAEFEAEAAGGEFDPAQLAVVRDELERAIVDALAPVATAGERARAQRFDALVTGACVVVPVLAVALYWLLGSPDMAVFSADHPDLDWRQPQTSMTYLLDRVRARLVAVPTDTQAWTVLARSELELGHHAAALAAAERLNALAPNQPSAMILLIDALAMQGGAAEHQRAREQVARLLEIDPHNASAIVMQGMFRGEAGDTPAALASWQQALGLTADPALQDEIKALITHAGGSVAATSPQLRIHAQVSLAPTLAAQLRPDDTVFVAVRAVTGPQIPLAVARRAVGDLPLTLVLDDSMAMVRGTALSEVKAFYVVARISHTGIATAASGDLEGRSAAQPLIIDADVAVAIDQVVP